MHMPKYLVTGGAGFIGCNIVRTLVQQGMSVVVLDNLSTGKRENLSAVARDIDFHEGDIRDAAAVQAACAGVDVVLHHAALRSVERSVYTPLETHDVNTTGTVQVLAAARDAGVRRVVFASSSSVYGNGDNGRNIETLTPAPLSPYALTKLIGEQYIRIFSDLYQLEAVSLRYFNVFGPYQNPESKYSAVIPIFIHQLLTSQTPTIDGDGMQSRDFTYVDNVVQANILAATSETVRPGEVYNIGNGENVSVQELFNTLQELLKTTIEPTYGPSRPGDVAKTEANIEKARGELGYQPQINFQEGLQRTVAWHLAGQRVAVGQR
jgi:UDP-glucose 4-epimerase